MKNIINICICALLAALVFTACKEEEVMTYSESKSGIMFGNHNNAVISRLDTLRFSFMLQAPDAESAVINIPLRYTGFVADCDRTAQMVTIKEPSNSQSKYELMTGTVKAGEMGGTIQIRLWNTPNLHTAADTLTVQLVENSDFTVKYIASGQRTDILNIVFYQQITKPLWWNTGVEFYLGAYTEQKLSIILAVFGTIESSPTSTGNTTYNVYMLNKYCRDNNILDEGGKLVIFGL